MKMLQIPPNNQTQQLPPLSPLINHRGEDVIYIGVGMLAIIIILIVGLLNRRLEYAIIFSILLAAVLILLIVLT
jgi:hypothetical protein